MTNKEVLQKIKEIIGVDNIKQDLPFYQVQLEKDTDPQINQRLTNIPITGTFKIVDEEKRLVFTPLIVAEEPIYRKDAERGEYYIKISAKTIQNILPYFIKSFSNLEGLEIRELWTVGDVFDKVKHFGLNLKYGSLVAIYKVTDDNIWEKINKSGLGISIGMIAGLTEDGKKE
jgi:hypothetical protein